MHRNRLAPLLPILLLATPTALLQGCGGPLLSVEVKDARITSTNVPFSATSVPGPNGLGLVTADLGPLGKAVGGGCTTDLNVKQTVLRWNDPVSHPDFTGVTSATLTAIPGPGSTNPPKVVATYTQDPANKNPAQLLIVGDPALNFFDLLNAGVLTLRLDATGTTVPATWTANATVVVDLKFEIGCSL